MASILDMLKKKKDAGEMNPQDKEAKLSVLKEIRDLAAGEMGKDLSGHMDEMKKVMVASPDKQGLEKGLDKAKEMLGAMPDDSEEAAEGEEPAGKPDLKEEMSELSDYSPEELDALMESIKAAKEKKSQKM